jgi:hypothetical protein
MPSLEYPCEFCNVVMRRDAIASHIKAKHTEDIKQRLFKQYNESTRKEGTIIHKVMAYKDPITMVIESETIEDGEYWFGIKPDLFIVDDSKPSDKGPSRLQKAKTAYLHSKQNLEFHLEFIKSIIDSITLLDMMKHNITVLSTSPEYINLKKSEGNLAKENRELKEKIDASSINYTRIFRENEELKRAMEIPDTIQLLHFENKTNKMKSANYETVIEQQNSQLKNQESRIEELENTIRQINLNADYKIFNLENSIQEEVSKAVKKAEVDAEKKIKKQYKTKEEKKKKAKKLAKIAELSSDSDSE